MTELLTLSTHKTITDENQSSKEIKLWNAGWDRWCQDWQHTDQVTMIRPEHTQSLKLETPNRKGKDTKTTA